LVRVRVASQWLRAARYIIEFKLSGHLLNGFSGYRLSLFRVGRDEGVLAQHVDHSRDALRVSVHGFDGFSGENQLAVAAGNAQALGDVTT
jgi:hypothetical protein